MEAVGRLLRGQRILITGAAGSIGGEMVRQDRLVRSGSLDLGRSGGNSLHDIRLMMARDWRDINAYTLVADIANKSRMEEIFSEHRPAYVFHAAAYKHVPMMEDNPCESVGNNVGGTRVIADLAVEVWHEEVRDDLHGQGGESHERDGLLETYLRDLRAEPRQSDQGGPCGRRDAVRYDPLRQRAGF